MLIGLNSAPLIAKSWHLQILVSLRDPYSMYWLLTCLIPLDFDGPLSITEYKSTKDIPYQRDMLSPIYSGTYGAVYKVTWEFQRQHVFAVKEIQIVNKTDRALVEKEIRLLRKCNHPNIIKLFDAYRIREGVFENTLFLVIEPWAPVSLQRFLESITEIGSTICPWYKHDTADVDLYLILKGFVDGISYMHEQGIKHKDIKPCNLLLFDTGNHHAGPIPRPYIQAKIADLGISKFQRLGGTTNFTRATYSYLAPEQINHTESTLKADIFSMGCCSALMLGVVCNGHHGFRQVWATVMDDASCQFGRELNRLLPFLKKMHTSTPTIWRFIGPIIEEMLIAEPSKRPDSKTVKELFEAQQLVPSLSQKADLGTNKQRKKQGTKEDDKLTALTTAIRDGQVEVVKVLLKAGSDINAYDRDGFTPLTTAVWWITSDNAVNAVDVVKLLVKAGADVNACDRAGFTPLTTAVGLIVSWNVVNVVEMAKVLLKAGADVNACDGRGFTPLTMAAWTGSFEVVEVLTTENADVLARDKEGRTALSLARARNHTGIERLLVDNGAQ
jgi:serine/threonine protein kinase